jgi:hypothetical protein
MHTGKPLGEILLEETQLDKEDLDKALEQQKFNITPLGQILLQMQVITPEDLNRALTRKFGSIYLNPNRYRMPNREALLALIPVDYARKFHCFPLDLTNNILTIAIDNPFYTDAVAQLTRLTKLSVRFVHSPKHCIDGLIEKYYLPAIIN